MESIFVNVLLPVCICVVLPVLIVWIISTVRKNEVNRKAEIMLKAIEAGVPIDPEVLQKPKKRARTIKEDLLERLNGACVTSFMGIAFLVSGLVFYGSSVSFFFFEPSYLIVTGCILLAIGIALFLVYCTGKKLLAKEIEAEEKNFSAKE